MKIHKRYYKILAENDSYKTPENIKRKSSFWFYPRLVKIFLDGNRLAKKNLYDRYNWVDSSLRIIDLVEKRGVKLEISGMNNLKKFDGPAIFVGNHMSTLETLALPAIINPIKSVVFVTKKELNSTPLFGPINSARHPIVVGRSNAREDLMQVMNQGAERIRDGRSIILFPQKTRSVEFDIKNFNTLGVKLAKKNNVPVVPFALLTDAWPNGKLIKDFGKIDPSKKVFITFGAPIEVTGNGAEQHKKIIEFITSHLKTWGRGELIKE